MNGKLGKFLLCLVGGIFVVAGGVMCAYEDFTLGPIVMAVGAIAIISIFRTNKVKGTKK